MRKQLNNAFKIALSVFLGGAILYWMYRDFDFGAVQDVILYKMNWWWMLLSFPFGIMAQTFRGWRWKQSLEPLGEKPRTTTSINAIFLSYAVSLVIPRIGEFARCGVLTQKDGVSFPKALGTVVTERAIDSLLVMLITATVMIIQMPLFDRFFLHTGTDFGATFRRFSWQGYFVTAICAVAVVILLSVAPAVDIRQGKDHAEGNSRRSDVTEKREERTVVSFLHRRYMGELLPALLPHLLLL